MDPTDATEVAASLTEALWPLMHAVERLDPTAGPLDLAALLHLTMTGGLGDLVTTKCLAALQELEVAAHELRLAEVVR